MSRRGRNNVKAAIVRDAGSLFGANVQPKVTATNNFNPLFHYLQSMFPNYDNSVLHSVLEQEGNSIERAIEVLLSFASSVDDERKPKESDEITFLDEFNDTEIMPPAQLSHNSGRDHVFLYEYQKRTKANPKTRNRRRRALSAQRQKRQQQQLQQQQQQVEAKKKVSWVPLEDFIVDCRNSFEPLSDEGSIDVLQLPLVPEPEVQKPEPVLSEEEEARALLSPEEVEESWTEFEEATAEEEEWCSIASPLEAPLNDSGVHDWCSFTVAEPEATSSAVPEQPAETCDATPTNTTHADQKVVVKLYYSSSDIHRLSLKRSSFTFAKLYDYAGAYLNSKCQLLPKLALPRAFALTYVDEEGDTIHLCSEEELAEALRLHDEVFWTDGKQPILRLHIKSLEAAVHTGHFTVVV